MNVDPRVYYDAATACDQTSRSMRAQVESLRGSLAGCGAMVGDYDSVKQWGTGYDKGVADFFHAAETWVDASSKLAEVANAAGYNWAVAEHTANPSPGPAPTPPTSTHTSIYLQCMAPPPTSLGKNGDGLDTDVPGLLEQIGLPVPDGDSNKLSTAASAWQAFASHPDTTGAGGTMSTAASRFEGMDAPDVAALTDHLDVLQRSAAELVSTASALATPVSEHHSAVTDLRAGIKSTSDDLVLTLGAIGAVTAIAVVATVLFTGGLALLGPAEGEGAAGGAALATAIAAAANTIRGLMTASTLAVVLGAATATFAAISGVTMVSALEGITMLVAQHLPAEGTGQSTNPDGTNPDVRREDLARDPAHGGEPSPQSYREADAALEAEANGVLPGPVTRAPFNSDGQDQGDIIDGDGKPWDIKSSPDEQPSYRPDAGKPIPTPQSDSEVVKMIERQLNRETGVLLDSDGMSAARRSHIEDLIGQHPKWAGEVRWSS